MTSPVDNPFAQAADLYAQARPTYPTALYDWLLAHTRGRDAAWDCATGNGQAAVDLAAHFRRVEATDLSEEQVDRAQPAPHVRYSAQPADATSFPDQAFDLVVVAQALHWFKPASYWPEVRRVARPGALFCAWGYSWFDVRPDVMESLVLPLRELLQPFWAPENRVLWDGYRDEDIAFPFARMTAPSLHIEVHWSVEQLIAYMRSWSACQRAENDGEVRPRIAALLAREHERYEGQPGLTVTMPLTLVAGTVQPV